MDFYGARFPDRKEGIWSKTVRNVGASSIFLPPRKKKNTESWG